MFNRISFIMSLICGFSEGIERDSDAPIDSLGPINHLACENIKCVRVFYNSQSVQSVQWPCPNYVFM